MIATYGDGRILIALNFFKRFPVCFDQKFGRVIFSVGPNQLLSIVTAAEYRTYMKPVPRLATGCIGEAAAIS